MSQIPHRYVDRAKLRDLLAELGVSPAAYAFVDRERILEVLRGGRVVRLRLQIQFGEGEHQVLDNIRNELSEVAA